MAAKASKELAESLAILERAIAAHTARILCEASIAEDAAWMRMAQQQECKALAQVRQGLEQPPREELTQ